MHVPSIIYFPQDSCLREDVAYFTYLKTGYPNAHCAHEQQVVSQELLQLGHATSL